MDFGLQAIVSYHAQASGCSCLLPSVHMLFYVLAFCCGVHGLVHMFVCWHSFRHNCGLRVVIVCNCRLACAVHHLPCTELDLVVIPCLSSALCVYCIMLYIHTRTHFAIGSDE
jgi:hypothetical protein